MLGCVLAVAGLLFAVAQSSRVQTAAVGVFVRQLETGLGTTANVAEVDYRFPNKLLIRGAYLEDQLGDTLLYADTLRARFDMLRLLREEVFCVRSVDLRHVRLYTHTIYHETDSLSLDSCMNYQFLVDAFKSEEETESKPFPITLEVKNVGLVDARLQYNDLLAQSLSAELALNHLSADSLDAEVDSLALTLVHFDRARSAAGTEVASRDTFRLNNFRAHVILTDSLLSLPEVYAATPASCLQATDMQVMLKDSTLFSGASSVALHIEQAHLTPKDLQFFVPSLRSFKGYVDATGELEGSVDSLHASGFSLSYNNQRLLVGDVSVYGLPNLDSMYIRADCQDFYFNKGLLQDVVSNVTGKPFKLPELVARLGNVHYRGILNGRLNNLHLNGAFTTALGNITTNGRATTDKDFSRIAFSGEVKTTHFALGSLLDNKELGAVGLTVNVDGEVGDNHPFQGKVCANIDHLEFKKYNYHNLHLDGTFHNNVFEGELGSKDNNLNFAFNGLLDLKSADPSYNFLLKLNHFRPGKLNLTDKYADSDLRCSVKLNGRGLSLEKLLGSLSVDTLTFSRPGKSLHMKHLGLNVKRANASNALDSIVLNSDYVSARMYGNYDLATLPATVEKLLIRYVPQMFSEKTRQKALTTHSSNEVTLEASLNDFTDVCSVLDIPLAFPSNPYIRGEIDEKSGNLMLRATAPAIVVGGRKMEQLRLNLDNEDNRINFNLSTNLHHTNVPASKHMGDMKLELDAHAMADSVTLGIDWQDADSLHNAGHLRLASHFGQYAGRPLIATHVYPTEVLLGDSVWQIGDSRITYNASDTALQIKNLTLQSNMQRIYANGVASSHSYDSLRVELQKINLDYLLGALTDVHNAIYFGGTVTGWVNAYNLFRNPKFEADVEMLHAKINKVEIGDVYATATLDKRNHVIINGKCLESFSESGESLMQAPDSVRSASGVVRRNMVDVYGDIGGSNGNWDLRIRPDSVKIGFISHWVNGILVDMDGRASGDVHVYGYDANTRVTVAAKAHNIGFTVPFTGARYYTSDSVIMDTTSIRFSNMTLHDKVGNPLHLDGGVYHDGDFKDLSFKFEIDVDKAVALDLKEDPKSLYSGTIFATGHVDIDGTESLCRVDAKARTEAGSNITIMTGGASTAASSDFIHFVDHTPQPEEDEETPKHVAPFAIMLNLDIDATPDILARVVIDPKTGDQLQGRGDGHISLSYHDPGTTAMQGGLTLQQGKFSFTLQNVIRREFDIKPGGTVTWNGPIESPAINVQALYHVTASLRDLFGSDFSQVSATRSSVPVDCALNLSGNLDDPVIRFGIDLPSSEESVRAQVASVINTEDMLTRQVLYLLVFNRFYTPEYLQNTQNVGMNETFSLISSTVTGQINNWLGKVTNAFTLGFNFRTDGEGATASQEYEAQFEIHPVDKLLINGNFGYRYNDISNQPIFGNLDVEYMLTKDGKLRAKAYTHSVDRYSLRQANTVQGLGLIFKHDFNWRSSKKKDTEQQSDSLRLDSIPLHAKDSTDSQQIK